MNYTKLLGIPVMAIILIGCNDTKEAQPAPEENVKETVPVATTPTEQVAETEVETQPAKQQKNESIPIVEQDPSSATHVRVSAEVGYIREQPSLEAPVATAGAQNNTYEYLNEKVHTSDGRTWYKVSHGNGIGYISSAVGELLIEGDPPVYSNLNIMISEANGNVRAEPSLNSAIIYKGTKGDTFATNTDTVHTSDGRTWYRVNIDGRNGFISSRVVTVVGDYDYDIWPSVFIISSAEGNVRALPSITSPVVYTGKKNQSLDYTGYYENTSDGRTWYEVYVPSYGYGYISGAVGSIR